MYSRFRLAGVCYYCQSEQSSLSLLLSWVPGPIYLVVQLLLILAIITELCNSPSCIPVTKEISVVSNTNIQGNVPYFWKKRLKHDTYVHVFV